MQLIHLFDHEFQPRRDAGFQLPNDFCFSALKTSELCKQFHCFCTIYLRRPFANFVDSPYYSRSELCGGAVTVSFSKYLPWQAMHFLQRPTHFSKTCCRPLITSKFVPSELPFHGWKSQKSHGARSELNSVFSFEKVDRWNPIKT
jgi:hypothetical protein